MERIYISGPMKNKVNNNKSAFYLAEEMLKKKGYEVFNPHSIYKPNISYEEYLKLDIRALTFCDSIYMLKGWKESKGANLEKLNAEAFGLKILYE
jgi:hypothetical protein